MTVCPRCQGSTSDYWHTYRGCPRFDGLLPQPGVITVNLLNDPPSRREVWQQRIGMTVLAVAALLATITVAVR